MQHNSKSFDAARDLCNVPTAKKYQGHKTSAALADMASRLFKVVDFIDKNEPLVVASPIETAKSNTARLTRIIKFRRMRDRYFHQDMFADAQWDILLDLALARLTHRQVMVSSVAIAAAVPTSTALRCIKLMLDNKLIERMNDPVDRRRSYLRITDDAFLRMTDFLRATAASKIAQ